MIDSLLLLLSMATGVPAPQEPQTPPAATAPREKSPVPLIVGVTLSVIYLIRRRHTLQPGGEKAGQPG